MNDSETPTDTPETPYTSPETSAENIKAPGDFQEAALGPRIGAALIDSVLCGILFVIPFIGWIFGLAYMYVLRDCLPFLDGQSVGKKLLKLRAVNEAGESLSGKYSEGIIRNLVLLIPFFGIVELIILITKNGKPEGLRRLGDEWGKTRVIVEG